MRADLDTLIWLIIVVAVALAKGWSKLQESIDKHSAEAKEPRPVTRPKPQRARPQPRPAVPPVARPQAAPPPSREPWRVDGEQIRRFVEQLSQPREAYPQPAAPPVAPPPVRRGQVPRPRPAPPQRPVPAPRPEPVAVAHAPAPAARPALPETRIPVPASISRAALWAEALRDRQNIRNIIISAEIIGPPKAFQ